MLSAPCLQCGAPVEYDPEFQLGNKDTGVVCADCVRRQDWERRDLARISALHDAWQRICPPRYRNTVVESLPYPGRSQEALSWEFGQGMGLNLWGFPDTGKTRTLYVVLRRFHMAGKQVKVFAPGDFSSQLASRDFSRSAWVRGLCSLDFVAFDDMDKLNLTREQELVFFGLLDKRMSHNLPCVFTHNSNAADLEYHFRNGRAMVRRIRQFTKSIHFPERTVQQRLF